MTDSESFAPAPSEDALGDAIARERQGFGLVGLAATFAVILGSGLLAPLNALPALLWARWSRTPLATLGFVRPHSIVTAVVGGAALGAALKLVMKALVMPLLGASAQNAAYAHLIGDTAALPGMVIAIVLGAGLGEETLFRGFLFARLRARVGTSVPATAAIVAGTSVWFGLVHGMDQGLAGVQQALLVGLVLGGLCVWTRQIWTGIVVHVAFDLTALALIYFDLEREVAHALGL